MEDIMDIEEYEPFDDEVNIEGGQNDTEDKDFFFISQMLQGNI